MQMEMKHGLACARTVIQDGAVAGEEFALACELCGDQLQLAKHGLILGCGFGQRFEMFPRANQDMRGRLRADVLEREDVRIFVDDLRWNFLRGNLAEQTVGAHRIAPAGVPSSNRVTKGVKPSRSRSCSPNWRAASSPEILPTRTR